MSVKKTSAGYEVTIKGETISLPPDSKMTESRRDATLRYGTPNKYLEFIQGGEVYLVNMGDRRMLAEEDEGVDISENFTIAWSDPEEEDSAPAPLPAAAPPKKEGVLKRMLSAAKKRATTQAEQAKEDAEKHVREVKKEAKDVTKAIGEVQDKLRDLEKACSTGLKGGRSSRVNRKTRRSKSKRRYTKRR